MSTFLARSDIAASCSHTHTQTHTHMHTRIHSEALEKRKSNKLNWFVRSYFAPAPAARSVLPAATPPKYFKQLTTGALRCVLRF